MNNSITSTEEYTEERKAVSADSDNVTGPVGTDWMVDRFGTSATNWDGYTQPVTQLSLDEAYALPIDGEGWSATKKRRAEKDRRKAIDDATQALRVPDSLISGYLEWVTSLKRQKFNDEGFLDASVVDGPLGDELPATITPMRAAEWAEDLASTFPRLVELLELLRRREAEDQDSDNFRVVADYPFVMSR